MPSKNSQTLELQSDYNVDLQKNAQEMQSD